MTDYHVGFGGLGHHDPSAVYTRPPAPLNTAAEHHAEAQWHVCAICRESWLCRARNDAHGHPGCSGKPYEFGPLRGEPVPPLLPLPEEPPALSSHAGPPP